LVSEPWQTSPMRIAATTITWAVLATIAIAADTITGRVVGITDGDTITLRTTSDTIKVRLSGIDTPERGQPFGTRAKQALSGQVFCKTVTVTSSGEHRYGSDAGQDHRGRRERERLAGSWRLGLVVRTLRAR
jgi:endonuclease YncB( thermonuclease family)